MGIDHSKYPLVPANTVCRSASDIAEQRRVVVRIKECLTRVEEMQRLRGAAQADMDALAAAALQEAWETKEITESPSHKLDDLGDITTGNTPSRKVPDFFAESGVPWITPGDMNDVKDITSGREFLSPKGIKEGRARVVAPNTVAVCCIGATIGKVAILRQPTGINQQSNAITFGVRIWPDYSYWACRALYPHILANAAQATLPILNKSRFGELTIPVPPIEAQKRLASRLNKVLGISLQMKQTTEESQAEEHAFRDSILREAFAGNL
jgi:type I restriction enzyme S subunit